MGRESYGVDSQMKIWRVEFVMSAVDALTYWIHGALNF